MTDAQTLLLEIEAAAKELNLSASTIGRLAGQGGGFVSRLEGGKRVWPETAKKVRDKIAAERAKRDAENKRGAA